MITVKRKLQIELGPRGQQRVKSATPRPELRSGKIPRVSRLMALAIHYDWMLRSGQVDDLDAIARLGHITQPRVSQILSLNLLAPEIQEELLHLPLIEKGRDPIHEKKLRRLTAVVDWTEQRQAWEEVKRTAAV